MDAVPHRSQISHTTKNSRRFRGGLRRELDDDLPFAGFKRYARRRRLRGGGKRSDDESDGQQLSTLHYESSSNVQRGVVRAFVTISRVSASLFDTVRLVGCSVDAR